MYIKKILLAIVFIGLLTAAIFSYFVYKTMLKPNTGFSKEFVYILIPSTASYSDIKEQLTPLLQDIDSFDALAKQKKYTNNFKAGRYKIIKGMNNNEIINSIRSENQPVTVSFNNQETLEKLSGRIANQLEADSLTLLNAMKDTTFLKANHFTKETALAMYLPNTYEFFWNTSAELFRTRMLKEYDKFWNSKRIQKLKTLGMTKNQVVTLASIVYEESKQVDEQPRVAGVYINRLKKDMLLQADPTAKFAAYQLPKYKNTVIKRVLFEHLEIDSPYNTYKYLGLPPGPIAMPDISAIDAVLNYEKHNFIFFAADTKRIGYHKFAKTFAQHNLNARAYQRYMSLKGVYK